MNDNQEILIVDRPLGIVEAKPEESPVLYKLYKLRRKSDGLYSTGGTSPGWSKKGKTWNTLAALSGHLAQHRGDYYAENRYYQAISYNYWGQSQTKPELKISGIPWDNLEIVLLEVRENITQKQEATDYVAGMNERREKREAREKAAAEKRKIEQAKKQLEEAQKRVEDLKVKYGF
jgi:hypothetical protein